MKGKGLPIDAVQASRKVQEEISAPLACVGDGAIVTDASAQARLNAILEQTSDLIATATPDAKLTYLNQAGRAMVGWGLEESLDDRVIADLHPLRILKKIETEGLPAAVATGVWEGETVILHRNGREIPVSQVILAHRSPDGILQYFSSIMRNITERKRAEEESKAHIRFLECLERVDQVIKQETDVEQMLWNITQTVFTLFNCDRAWLLYPCDPEAPSFCVPIEVTRSEYPGAKIFDIDVPMSPDQAQNMRETLEADEPVTYTAGTERPITTAKQFGVQSQMFVPLYPKLGKPWVFGMHQCSYPRIWTKDEKKLFKEISRRISDGLSSVLFLRELQENEERFRATFEQAAVGIAHVAPDGRWLRVNQKLCDIVGYFREELLQMTFQDITCPEDLDANLEYIRQVLTEENSMDSIEKRYICKDGSLAWINLTVSVVRSESGDPAYFIAVVEDIAKPKKWNLWAGWPVVWPTILTTCWASSLAIRNWHLDGWNLSTQSMLI